MLSLNCQNCEQPLPDAAAFCTNCGQSTRTIQHPWWELLWNLVRELFDFDGRMFTSLRLLMFRPGYLTRAFVEGRRRAYTSPIRMYLVISLVFFFVLPAILPEPRELPANHEANIDLYSQAMFVLLPVLALLMKLFYRGAFYVAHLVFAMHLFSAMFIVFGVMLSVETAADRYTAVMLLQVALLLYMLWYCVLALKISYMQGWTITALKFFGLLMLFLPILGGAIELASHWGGLMANLSA